MATQLPFNQITFGGSATLDTNKKITAISSPSTTIGPDKFAYGTGSIRLAGQDSAVTTADGMIHNYRSAVTPSGSCTLRGDQRLNDTAAPTAWEGQTWPVQAGVLGFWYVSERNGTETLIAAFNGIISIEYDSNNNQSQCTINGVEVTY